MRTTVTFSLETSGMYEEAPRAVAGGAWWSGCRGGGHSVVTSVTAARALDSSTMALFAANAATRAWMARLFTARGRPRETWWMSATASSLNKVSARPASLGWWAR